jgi:hypothetical protein
VPSKHTSISEGYPTFITHHHFPKDFIFVNIFLLHNENLNDEHVTRSHNSGQTTDIYTGKELPPSRNYNHLPLPQTLKDKESSWRIPSSRPFLPPHPHRLYDL